LSALDMKTPSCRLFLPLIYNTHCQTCSYCTHLATSRTPINPKFDITPDNPDYVTLNLNLNHEDKFTSFFVILTSNQLISATNQYNDMTLPNLIHRRLRLKL